MAMVPQTLSATGQGEKNCVLGVAVPRRVCPPPANNPVRASEERACWVHALVPSAQPSGGVVLTQSGGKGVVAPFSA